MCPISIAVVATIRGHNTMGQNEEVYLRQEPLSD